MSSESTFNALYNVSIVWRQQDDFVYLFGGSGCVDDRQRVGIETVWTFDLDEDVLHFKKEKHHSRISPERVRQAPVTTLDFEFEPRLAPALLKTISTDIIPPPYSTLTRQGLDMSLWTRRKALLPKILNDFAFQWRHVLDGPYNNSTFRRLAYAIVRIVSLDFTIVEIDRPRWGNDDFFVRLQDLPTWDSHNRDIIRVGGVSIVISQHIVHAMSLIHTDFRDSSVFCADQDPANPDTYRTYLILSLQEIFLYQISETIIRKTKPQSLFDKTWKLSPEAMDLLPEATQNSLSPTPINNIAIELQASIIDILAMGPLQRAKLCCELNVDSGFTWKCGGRMIEREEVCRHRIAGTPVESQIWFDSGFSGLAYK